VKLAILRSKEENLAEMREYIAAEDRRRASNPEGQPK
jgi:hypothetical protein